MQGISTIEKKDYFERNIVSQHGRQERLRSFIEIKVQIPGFELDTSLQSVRINNRNLPIAIKKIAIVKL